MDDRTLLELAAKAAGLEGYSNSVGSGPIYRKFHTGLQDWVRWNPLTDDGDALRLAVRLHISIDHNKPACQQRYVVAERCGCEMMYEPVCAVEDVDDETDRDAATRRAIVRAAAEMAK